MQFGRIVFVLAYNASLPGPSAPILGHTAGEVIVDVHSRMQARAAIALGSV